MLKMIRVPSLAAVVLMATAEMMVPHATQAQGTASPPATQAE